MKNQKQTITKFKGIDYAFTPNYFEQAKDVKFTVLRKIKGAVRRKFVEQAIDNNQLLPVDMINDSLDDNLRTSFGAWQNN